jgi:hypothetical protein
MVVLELEGPADNPQVKVAEVVSYGQMVGSYTRVGDIVHVDFVLSPGLEGKED